MYLTLHSGWHDDLAMLVGSAKERLVVASPFITDEGAALVCRAATASLRTGGSVEVITDLSSSHVVDGSLAMSAVVDLFKITMRSKLWHVPRLHAKVYIADDAKAIVTSANLTAGGFFRNHECGVYIEDPAVVTSIQANFNDFRIAGTLIGLEGLLAYSVVANQVRDSSARRDKTVDPRLDLALKSAIGIADDQLIRLRLAGGALHTVFAQTIRHLLLRYGPTSTVRLHELVRDLHPELCDDSVDRVIDGQHFGKKWKHAVRTAQQQLKRTNIVEYVEPLWQLTEHGNSGHS